MRGFGYRTAQLDPEHTRHAAVSGSHADTDAADHHTRARCTPEVPVEECPACRAAAYAARHARHRADQPA